MKLLDMAITWGFVNSTPELWPKSPGQRNFSPPTCSLRLSEAPLPGGSRPRSSTRKPRSVVVEHLIPLMQEEMEFPGEEW
ncbi:gp1 [Corynebacterium phage P1201]|uniref:Gp1 n=1 Tax=Corynebacterium phage P1201 TaxID=384848 RepID=A7IY72_9CAUD|nr:gp1 [Corynebacterium phage P1201]ABF57455.1 gp1 [Corynebacterium phage P1201]